MKKKLSRVLAVLLGVLMLAVCIPAAAFAEEGGNTEATGDVTFKLTVWYPTEAYLEHFGAKHVNLDVGDTNEPYCDVEKSKEIVATGVNSITLPTEINGQKVTVWMYMMGVTFNPGSTLTKEELSADSQYSYCGFDKKSEISLFAVVPGLYPEDVGDAFNIFYAFNGSGKSWDVVAAEYYAKKNGTTTDTKDADTDTTKPETTETPATEQPAATTFVPQLQSQSSEPAVTVDTRTEQQKEIDEAIANGTWGIEYTTCQKCGYHNWTRQGNVYVCDTCGNTTTEVVSAKGVKGYVGSGAIAAVAPGKTVDDTPKYATAKEAQAAADKREAAYAAAVAAFQKQIAEQNAAYLASLK